MTTKELLSLEGFEGVCVFDDREITGAFAGDLLSWAMSRVEENMAWFTVMGNINTIAVAALSDCACVVLCHGAALSEDAFERCKKEEINLFKTELSEYEAITSFNKLFLG